MLPLLEIQTTLRRLITAPDGVAEALRAESDPRSTKLDEWVRSDARLPAADRLEVYANAYFERIRECLEGDYPALRWALGEEWFRDLVTAYLIAHPSRHPSLRFAGGRLPDYLAEDTRAEPFRRKGPWLADLARYERALLDAFDAADADTVSGEALRNLDSDAWGSLRFTFQPALRILSLEWPVRRLRSAWEAGDPPAEICAQASWVLIWRRDERVFQRPVESDELSALQLGIAGRSFAEICEGIAERIGDEQAPAQAAGWLGRWQEAGLLAGLTIRGTISAPG